MWGGEVWTSETKFVNISIITYIIAQMVLLRQKYNICVILRVGLNRCWKPTREREGERNTVKYSSKKKKHQNNDDNNEEDFPLN